MSPYHRRLGGVAVALALLLVTANPAGSRHLHRLQLDAIALAAWIALAAPLGFIVVRLLVAGRTKTVDPAAAAQSSPRDTISPWAECRRGEPEKNAPEPYFDRSKEHPLPS
jgi:hypothetical protein